MGKRIQISRDRLPEIETALAKEKDAKVVRWLFGVRLVALGKIPRDIAAQLDTTERSVRNWTHRFLDNGIEGMQRHASPGQPTHLPSQEEERFKQRIRQGPTADDGVCTWRGPSILRMLQREFGAAYQLSGVYRLMHRMGFSSLMPRAQHPESSAEEQERFQKKRCRRRSTPSDASTRTAASRCGSKTKPGSASKAR